MKWFDNVTCINLIERRDKYNNAKAVFDNLNLDVEFFFAEKHKQSGRIGCFESHINVIKKCYNSNANNLLIFEDDVINTSYYNEAALHNISTFLQKNCTHAYLLTRQGMQRVLNTWEKALYKDKMDLDVYYKNLFVNNGASYCPILFDQNFCISNDNEPATTLYYIAMRKISCIQYKYSFLYFLSLIRFYRPFFLFLILIILLIICMKIFKIGSSLNRISKLFSRRIKRLN
jgi:GR25 family glycosyltransferase involved in LPS biosynthesis